MRKKAFSTCHVLATAILFLFIPLFTNAQTVPDPNPDNQGGTITTTVTTDDALTETTRYEIKDKDGFTRKVAEVKIDIRGNREETVTLTTAGGRVTYTSTKRVDSEGKITFVEWRQYKKGTVVSDGATTTYTYHPDGSATRVTIKPATGEKITEKLTKAEVDARPKDPVTSPFINPTPPPPPATGPTSCAPKATIFAGPSIMNVGYANGRETLIGANVAGQYQVTQRIGVVVDASMHSMKNEYEEKFRHISIGGGAQYSFPGNCNLFVPFVQLLAARHLLTCTYGGEKYFEQGAFSILAGGGAVYNFNNNIGAMLQAHYMAILWQAAAAHYIRVSLGVRVGLGRSN